MTGTGRITPADIKPPEPAEIEPVEEEIAPFEPKTIKPTDHAKYYIVKEPGRLPFLMARDKNENRRIKQLDSAKARALVSKWMDLKMKSKADLKKMTPLHIKQVVDILVQLDTLDSNAWQEDRPLKPRTGDPDDTDDLMADAIVAGIKMKEKIEALKKKQIAIDIEAIDSTGTDG